MRKVVSILALVVGLSTAASAQVCGDIDGASGLNILDAIRLYNHLIIPIGASPVGNGDVDGRAGIALPDALRLLDRVLYDGTLDCSGAAAYSFAPSPNDTVFVPYMSNIPDDIDTAIVFIGYSLSDSSRGLYLPLLTRGISGTTNFRLSHVSDIGLDASLSCDREFFAHWDTVVATYCGMPIADRQFRIKLTYIRTGPGLGEIRPTLVERDALLRPSIERDSDLVVPTIMPYEVQVPPDSLIVSGALFFTEIEGESFHWGEIEFRTNSQETTFRLRASDWWISMPFDGLAITPLRARFRVNTVGMAPGIHDGYVFVEAQDPNMVVTGDSLHVRLTVLPKGNYQNGDINCDEVLDINDLARLIAYLTSGAPLPPNCF